MGSSFKRCLSLSLAVLALLSLSVAQAELAATPAPSEETPAYSSITLDSKSVTLKLYQWYYIKLKSSKPAGAVADQMTYTSSNSKVAVVEGEGAIRAVAPGSATITVKAKNGKAKATLRIKVAKNKKPRLYDAAKDAEGVTQKAPLVDDSALGRLAFNSSRPHIEQMDQALLKKYGEAAATLSLPKVDIESAGGELYYALLYTLLKNEVSEEHRRGYVVIPSQFPGCSEATMAALRTWLREIFDGIVIGMSDEFFGENAVFDHNYLSVLGGVSLSIENIVPVNATCYIADVQQWYGELGASWHRILLERTNDGWRIDFSAVTLMA